MEIINVNSTSMFYFAVASVFVLLTILKSQSLAVSSNSKIASDLSLYLLVQAVLIGLYYLLEVLKTNSLVSQIRNFDILIYSVGLIMG